MSENTSYVTLINVAAKGRTPRYAVASREGAVIVHRPLSAAFDIEEARTEAQALYPDALVVALALGERPPTGAAR